MRTALLSAVLVAATLSQALAAPRSISHVLGASCFERSYDQTHLKQHPRQRVTSIRIADSVVPAGQFPGIVALIDIRLTLRGGAKAEAVGYCKRKGDTLNCTLEGDAGAITITRRGMSTILITVEERFDVETDRGFVELTKSDDRKFLLSAEHACLPDRSAQAPQRPRQQAPVPQRPAPCDCEGPMAETDPDT